MINFLLQKYNFGKKRKQVDKLPWWGFVEFHRISKEPYIYNSLLMYSCVRDAIVEDGPTAIPLNVIAMATESYAQKPRPHESELVSLYTPYLMEVVSEVSRDLRPVNSE